MEAPTVTSASRKKRRREEAAFFDEVAGQMAAAGPLIRHWLERLFFLFEPVVTALLYPYYVARERIGKQARVPILMYHQVGCSLPGIKACQECVDPERFEVQLRAILDAGYRVITLGQLIQQLDESRLEGLGRSVVLTFDDGYRGHFENAYPVLRRCGVPATFFLVAGYTGTNVIYPHLGIAEARLNPGDERLAAWFPLSWDQARGLARNGMEVGSHALSHRSLGCLSRDEVEVEIRRSREILEERLGVPVACFAYPFGARVRGDFDQGVQEMLREAGYRAACTTVVGRNKRNTDRFSLRRIPVEEWDGPFRIRCKLVGAYDWVGPVRELCQRLLPREERVDFPVPAIERSSP